ncbi:hypothetical protein [Gordonia iterans]
MIDFSDYPPLATAEQLGLSEAEAPAVAAAGEAIRNYCGWHIAPVVIDDVVVVDNSFGRRVLALPTMHLTSVESIVDRNNEAIEGFQWSRSGMLERPGGWPTGLQAVTATITHGLTEAPAAIRTVIGDLVSSLAKSGEVEQVGPFKLSVYDFRAGAAAYGRVLNLYRIPPRA